MESYLSRRAGCLYRQAASSWNVLDTLAYVMICNHWSATDRYRTFHDVPMNRGVSTEDYRGLTSYKRACTTMILLLLLKVKGNALLLILLSDLNSLFQTYVFLNNELIECKSCAKFADT
jgi:hypothetical protein